MCEVILGIVILLHLFFAIENKDLVCYPKKDCLFF